MPIHNKIQYPVEQIRLWIFEGKTQQEISDTLRKTLDDRITPKLIYKVCKKHGIKCQRTGPRSGEGHPEWKGGRIEDKNGYVFLFQPDHPECQRVNEMRRLKSNGKYFRKENYIQEHRVVMEEHLGRYLKRTEVVHHLNGQKDDNRLSNLVLFGSNAEHLAVDLKGRCPKWSEDGKVRILFGVLKRVAKQRLSKAPDAQERLQIVDQLKGRLPPSYRDLFGKAVEPLLLLA